MKRAIFSADEKFRYTLWREWMFGNGEYVQFIGLNPSIATDLIDDPTIRRCVGFAKRWGLGAYCMTNLFAYRATDPKVMKAYPQPIGLENDYFLKQIAADATMIVAAWGSHGKYLQRDEKVVQLLADYKSKLVCLGRNSDSSPRHPLYVPYSQATELFS